MCGWETPECVAGTVGIDLVAAEPVVSVSTHQDQHLGRVAGNWPPTPPHPTLPSRHWLAKGLPNQFPHKSAHFCTSHRNWDKSSKIDTVRVVRLMWTVADGNDTILRL